MRKVLFSLTLLATLTLLFSSCKKEEPLDREQFLGSYSVSRDCDISTNASYNMTVEVSAEADNKVILKNMTNQSNEILKADISGTSITIPVQSLAIGSGVTFEIKSGSGTINGNSLTINYSYKYVAGALSVEESCVLTCSKL